MGRFGPFRAPSRSATAVPHGIRELVTVGQPRTAAAEAYRTLWTNLAFSTVDEPVQAILLTSPGADDGKSTTLANLGVTAAQTGKQVLLVDGDLRRPTLHQIFDLPNSAGLTTALVASDGEPLPIQATPVPGLRVVTSGPLPSNPAEVLNSSRMDELVALLRHNADLVILDTPPAGIVADALALVPRVDGVVIVVDATHTRREPAQRTKEQLMHVKARILGVVLNNAHVDAAAYRY